MHSMFVRTAWHWRKVAGAAFLLAWFLYFCWGSLAVRFAPDDMMNMAYYFRSGPLHVLTAQVTPWTGYYRPMGGLFYLPLLTAFGLNPAPYHAAILLLLLASVALTYRFARLLGAAESAAGLAALALAYHPGLSNLYYNSAFVYDVLCLFFYLAAFVYYARIRALGRPLSGGQTAVFLLLFLCALNSKEMAATLPLALLAYEWLYHRPRMGWLAAILAMALDVAYCWGRVFGPGALLSQPGYRAVLSAGRLLDFQRLMLSDVFLNWHYAVWPLWVVLCFVAWMAKQPLVRFCWLFSFLIAPLPIEFLEGRRAACLAIPAAGLAVIASVLFVGLANAVGALAGPRRIVATAVVVAGVCLWAHRIHYLQTWLIEPAMARLGRSGGEVIRQFRALNPRVQPGAQVVILNDPSPDLETANIAQLWFRDRTVSIHLRRLNPLSPEEMAQMDCLLSFEDGKLVRVR